MKVHMKFIFILFGFSYCEIDPQINFVMYFDISDYTDPLLKKMSC